MRLYRYRFLVLLSAAPLLGAPQASDITNAVNATNVCVIGCTTAGNTSIANGNENVSNGQQTQNQAQMAMGAMQIAQGLLGLAAAAAAAAQAGKGSQNASNLGSTGYNPGSYDYAGTSPTPGSTNNGSTTGSSNTGVTETGNTVTLSPESLRSGQLGAALSNIEKNFGIPRDNFVKALQNGVDPKAILAAAPKNAPSMDLLGRIEAGLAAQNASKAAELLAAAGANGSGASTNLASVGGAGTGGAPTGASEEAKGPRMPASTAPPEEALDDLDNPANASLSPEVRAALAAKAASMKAEKEMKEMHGWSIFQLVHNRYKKLEPMLYGRVERTNVRAVPSEL